METKICKTCKQVKSLLEFYSRTSNLQDGLFSSCKECVKAQCRKRYATKLYRQQHRLYAREYRKTHKPPPESSRLNKAPTHKIRARQIGTKLPHPNQCEVCDKQGKTVAHHPDYNDPSLVVFVCNICHGEIHINN